MSGHRRRGAAIGDLVDLHFGFLRQQRRGEMAGRAVARDRGLQCGGLHQARADPRRVVRLERLAADQHQRIRLMNMTGVRSFSVSNGKILVKRDVGGNLQIVQQQRVAVRRRLARPCWSR